MTALSNLKESIYSIAIGLRFSPTFAVGDNLGKIADKVLYSKNSYFDPKFFPLVDSGIANIMLKNDPLTRYLNISTTDIILEVKKDVDTNFDIAILEEEYKKQILGSVLTTYQVRGIQRIGYLTKYKISDKGLSDSFCRKSNVDANNILMRFQKNQPMPEAMFKKNVNDYCSNIYTIIRASDSTELKIHSDYQIYFNPYLDSHEDIQYSKFLKAKNIFNEEMLPSWLKGYLDK